jgi:general secretion pathway protein G
MMTSFKIIRIGKKGARAVSERGNSLLELIVTIAILSILTAAAVPMAGNAVRSRKESELRQALREIRFAIDRYHDTFSGLGQQRLPIEERNQSGYPKSLKVLYEGIVLQENTVSGKKTYFLRKLPIDPMTGEADWVTRGSDKKPGESGGDDVFDVSSRSDARALNGTKYGDW